ncbi:unnamed protein product, partial [Rotaria sp. Silwood2]
MKFASFPSSIAT